MHNNMAEDNIPQANQVAIRQMIIDIRGVKVILDRDIAKLYGVTTGNLNKAVKRNIERFPERFMFQLTEEENLLFQNGISSWGGTRTLPYAFTEQGVAMLSSVLHSPTAIQVSISIIDAFVAGLREEDHGGGDGFGGHGGPSAEETDGVEGLEKGRFRCRDSFCKTVSGEETAEV